MTKKSPPAAPTDTTRVVLRLAPAQIVDLHCFIEGYDDLAVLRTLDAAAGLVEILVSPGAEEEFENLRLALCREGLPTTRIEEET
jgi:hypothetical protein